MRPVLLVAALATIGTACVGLGGLSDPVEGAPASEAGTSDGDTMADGGRPDAAAPTDAAGDPDANADVCAGIDLSSSAKHCGRCNHDCLGGACANGRCQPTTVLSGLTQPYGITVDATKLYWSSAGGNLVMGCDKASCNATPLSVGQNNPLGVVVSGAELWWVSQGGQAVRSCATANCASPTTHVATQGPLWGIAIDPTNVYFTDVIAGTLKRCGRADCSASLVTLSATLGNAYGVAVDGATLWVARSAGGAGAILQCTTSGCAAPTTFASNVAARPIAVDATRVYWGELDMIRACPRAGCTSTTPETLVEGLGEVTGIAVDATTIWFADYANNAIKRVAK